MKLVILRRRRQDPVQGLKSLYKNYSYKLNSNFSDLYKSSTTNVNSFIYTTEKKLRKQQRILSKQRWVKELKNGSFFTTRFASMKKWYGKKSPTFYTQLDGFFTSVENALYNSFSKSKTFVEKKSPIVSREISISYRKANKFANRVAIPRAKQFINSNFTKRKKIFA